MLDENEDPKPSNCQDRADMQVGVKEGAVRARIVTIYCWMQAQRAEKRLRRQHAKIAQRERGGRGAPCVRCGEGANARAHVASWRVYLDRCAATEQLSRARRVDLVEGKSVVLRFVFRLEADIFARTV